MTYDIADDLKYVTREVNSGVGNRSSVNILGGGKWTAQITYKFNYKPYSLQSYCKTSYTPPLNCVCNVRFHAKFQPDWYKLSPRLLLKF